MSDQSVAATRIEWDKGPYIDQHYALLRYVMEEHISKLPFASRGTALEFGVGRGTSTYIISRYMPKVFGFDSFEGLPEDWREGFPAGSFRCPKPTWLHSCGVRLCEGLFENTLPAWVRYEQQQRIGLLHIDCDLYSSTKTVFDNVGDMLLPGTVIVFDEFFGYDTCEQHEQRAWWEFVEESGVKYEVLGHSSEQWSVQLV